MQCVGCFSKVSGMGSLSTTHDDSQTVTHRPTPTNVTSRVDPPCTHGASLPCPHGKRHVDPSHLCGASIPRTQTTSRVDPPCAHGASLPCPHGKRHVDPSHMCGASIPPTYENRWVDSARVRRVSLPPTTRAHAKTGVTTWCDSATAANEYAHNSSVTPELHVFDTCMWACGYCVAIAPHKKNSHDDSELHQHSSTRDSIKTPPLTSPGQTPPKTAGTLLRKIGASLRGRYCGRWTTRGGVADLTATPAGCAKPSNCHRLDNADDKRGGEDNGQTEHRPAVSQGRRRKPQHAAAAQ